MKNVQNKMTKELERKGFSIEETISIEGVALTILDEPEVKAKPNKFGDCSLCLCNDCSGCKRYN